MARKKPNFESREVPRLGEQQSNATSISHVLRLERFESAGVEAVVKEVIVKKWNWQRRGNSAM
jgi:hypothetical protein